MYYCTLPYNGTYIGDAMSTVSSTASCGVGRKPNGGQDKQTAH